MLPAADFLVNFNALTVDLAHMWAFLSEQQDLLEDLVVIKFVLEIAKLYKDGL